MNSPVTSTGGARMHAQVWEMLPWLVNGRASDEQRTLAAEHLPHCADCRAELRAQQQLHQAVLEAAPPAVDADAGLERLLGRIAEPSIGGADALEAQPLPARAMASPRRPGRLATVLAAAVVIQAVGLGLLSLHLLQGDRADFRTLSQGQPVSSIATLRVLPDAGMAMADWQALLQAQGLKVVDGPNSMGAYALAPQVAAAGAAQRGEQTARQLARLRATAGIRLAEALDPVP